MTMQSGYDVWNGLVGAEITNEEEKSFYLPINSTGSTSHVHPDINEEPSRRGDERPDVGGVWKKSECAVTAQMSYSSLERGSKLRGFSSMAFELLYCATLTNTHSN
ncbi:hypothetical protein TNCV_1140511 [Trichonephila clavipes]|nr:hypothetical protein TNCV_1140511 [Trichonephila clavipes]